MDKLIIFVKNAELGKVKTRLAQTIGDQAALRVYQELLRLTAEVCGPLPFEKEVHYAGFIGGEDAWNETLFSKKRQAEGGLGEKMLAAFETAFKEGAQKTVLIGSDCPGISGVILRQAFENLNNADVVFGPAEDGGYYLIGLKKTTPALFQHKPWSTDTVLKDSLADCTLLGLSFALLPVLRDVDVEADLTDELRAKINDLGR